jgi:hypothetical protein
MKCKTGGKSEPRRETGLQGLHAIFQRVALVDILLASTYKLWAALCNAQKSMTEFEIQYIKYIKAMKHDWDFSRLQNIWTNYGHFNDTGSS